MGSDHSTGRVREEGAMKWGPRQTDILLAWLLGVAAVVGAIVGSRCGT